MPELKKYWNLKTGGLVANHLDEIGGDIDLFILDTVHFAPGEALDFLMVLPFLSSNAMIILHDLTYHIPSNKHANICALLFLALKGKKVIPPPYLPYNPKFQNIGSCILGDYNEAQLELYFRVLNLPWLYMPSNHDLDTFKNHISKYYDKSFVDFMDNIIKMQRKWLDSNQPKRSKTRLFFRNIEKRMRPHFKKIARLAK